MPHHKAAMIVPLLLSCVVSCGIPTATPLEAPKPSSPFVYASYMHCFVYGETAVRNGSEQWVTWTPSEMFDASWWPEQYAPQSDSGATAIRQDFVWAQQAGVDAFGVLSASGPEWWSTYGPTLNALAAVASTTSVKILPDLWPDPAVLGSSPEKIATFAKEVKDWMDKYPGAFAKVNGKYVISIGGSVTDGQSPAAAAAFQHFFDAWGGRSAVYVITDVDVPTDPAVWPSDAWSSWTPWNGWAEGVPNRWLTERRAWAWPVIPSYFQSRNMGMMAEDLGVSHYIDEWEQAISNGSSMVQIETWNDFGEDSSITDSNVRGTSLLDLTKFFTQWVHTGQEPTITQDRLFLFHHRQLTTTKLTKATKTAITEYWASRTPATDYIDVVSMLTTPATITVSAGTATWSKPVPAGLHQWLLYVPPPLAANTGPNGPPFLQAGSYPSTTPEREVTVIPALVPSTPAIEVTRSGKIILAGSSRTGWPASARWQDMSMIGDEFTATP